MSSALESAQRAFFSKYDVSAEPHEIDLKRLGAKAVIWSAGSGPPLLMLPGGPFVAATMAPLLPRLVGSHTVHVLERPGVGLAPGDPIEPGTLLSHGRALVADVLDAIGAPAVDLVANSLGATFAIAYASETSDKLGKLVILGPPGGIDRDIPTPLKVLSRPILGSLLFKTLGRPSLKGTRTMFEEAMVAHIDRVPEELLALQTMGNQQPGAWPAWHAVIRAMVEPAGLRADVELFDLLPKVRVPTSMIWGELDAVTPPARGEAVMRAIPGLDLRLIARAGHMAWFDEPEETARALQELVGTATAGEAAPADP